MSLNGCHYQIGQSALQIISKMEPSQGILHVLRSISVWLDLLDTIVLEEIYEIGRDTWTKGTQRILTEKKETGNQILRL